MGCLHQALSYGPLTSPQIFTGAVPFSDSLHVAAVLAITSGKRPQRPTHPTLTDKLWKLVQDCWDQDPRLRPEGLKVLKVLNGM
jgi:hypothetical protein